MQLDPSPEPQNSRSQNLYSNEKSDYSDENTRGNECVCSTILQPFQFEPEQKKKPVIMRAIRKTLQKLLADMKFQSRLEREVKERN